jgi:hypothetical protein
MSANFDELLLDGMERYTTDMHAPRNLVDRARRSRRQRLTLRTAASGVTATAIAAIAFAALPSTTHVTIGKPASQFPARHDIEYVHTTRPDKRGSSQTWLIQNLARTLSFSSAGHLTEEFGFRALTSKNGQATKALVTVVDFENKTWQRSRQSNLLNVPGPSCHPFQLNVPRAASDLRAWIRGVHRLIHCGALVAEGTEQVDGVKTIKLRATNPAGNGDGLPLTVWVRRSDYVPVKFAQGTGNKTTRQDVSWLPPTKANLAKLHVRIPAGFRHTGDASPSPGSHSVTCHVSSSHPGKQTCKQSR